jgi:hypothetical protein
MSNENHIDERPDRDRVPSMAGIPELTVQDISIFVYRK